MSETRAAQRAAATGADAQDSHRNATYFWIVIVPADGTRAANVGTGDFGTSPIFVQLSDKLRLVRIRSHGESHLKRNGASTN